MVGHNQHGHTWHNWHNWHDQHHLNNIKYELRIFYVVCFCLQSLRM